MVDVKPLSQVVDKWAQRAGSASSDYAAGAQAAGSKYAAAAAAAGNNYNAGVQAAIGRNAYTAGVQKAGSAKYTQGVQSKGASRYAGGIQAGKGNFSAGMQGVLSVIQGASLSPRGPTGDPANLQRSAQMAQILRQYKTGGGST